VLFVGVVVVVVVLYVLCCVLCVLYFVFCAVCCVLCCAYVVAQVAGPLVLQYFCEIFDGLCKLAADPEKGVQDGALLLNKQLQVFQLLLLSFCDF
jgi:hypothetical protein